MIRRKPIEDDDENHERWLVSYADFITLLFAFFVVMYAISSVNQSKYQQLTSAMGSAFMGQANGGIPNINTKKESGAENQLHQDRSLIKPLPLSYLIAEKNRKAREAMLKVGLDLSGELSPLINTGKVTVAQNNRGVRIDINDSLLFEAGSADLSPQATPLMTQIADTLKTSAYTIQIEGHTDNTPIHSATFFSNWELSAVRASSVVRMLNSLGIVENRLSATGFGSTQPISENETDIGRAKNRRVSIMILYESSNQDETALSAPTKMAPQPR